MEGEGMVAVVRGLRDAGLAVTLFEGGRQYTLLPNSVSVPARPRQTAHTQAEPRVDRMSNTRPHDIPERQAKNQTRTQDSSAQATDGQYTSVYRMSHCNMRPTSPPVHITEFPPQRAAISPGRDNFQVGGPGSGDTLSPTRLPNAYRAGSNFPEKGSSMINTRPSREMDAFASSLRKYPQVSPDRSAEIVERLISYTQAKNLSKPSRCSSRNTESTPKFNDFEFNTRNFFLPKKNPYDPEINVNNCKVKINSESPTRDRRRTDHDCVDCRKTVYGKNYDVRHLREVARTSREARNVSAYSTNSANMETQAAVEMASKEVSTSPRSQPSQRTVAIPLSPTSSANPCPEGGVSNLTAHSFNPAFKTTHTNIDLEKLESFAAYSSIDVPRSHPINDRTSKSEEEIKSRNKYELVNDTQQAVIKAFINNVLKKLNNKVLFDKLNSDQINMNKYTKINDCSSYRKMYEDQHKVRYSSPVIVYRADVIPFIVLEDDDTLIDIVRYWMNKVPIKSHDYLDRLVDKEKILNIFVKRLKRIMPADDNILKTEIVDMIGQIPIENNYKRAHLNRLADDLVNKIKESYEKGFKTTNYETKLKNDKAQGCTSSKRNYSNQYRLKEFIADEISDFLEKSRLEINCASLEEIEAELFDIFMDHIAFIGLENESLKIDINSLLRECGGLSEHQAIYFTNTIIEHYQEVFYEPETTKASHTQTYIILQNTQQSYANESSDLSIAGISDADIGANLQFYSNQLTAQIEEWLTNLNLPQMAEKSFRQVVVEDLAGDIVDRHKFLELNPSSRGSDKDELEHLKYQIFKWINKLVGENNKETIDHAPELMQRIQSIPVPMLTRPSEGSSSTAPPCCAANAKFNMSQMPMFGPSEPGGSMRETPRQEPQGGRRFSAPGGSYSAPMTNNYGNYNTGQMPMFGPSGPGGSMIETTRQTPSTRRMSAPGGFGQLPMFELVGSGGGRPAGSTQGGFSGPPGPLMTGINQMPAFGPSGPGGSMYIPSQQYSSERRQSSPGKLGILNTGAPSSSCPPTCGDQAASKPASATVDSLNEEYEKFVEAWVQKIPIEPNAADENFVEKARLGILNGIWKSIAKLKMQPELYHNRFFYEDMLDDEIEELFSLIPSTPEFESKKHLLKVELIDKTTETQQKIKDIFASASFKDQLVQNVSNQLPRRILKMNPDVDPKLLYEQLQILNLAEDYILCARYKEDDKMKASAYRRKLLKRVEAFVEELKAAHGKELKDIDTAMYINDILNALHKVPLPSEESIKEEADEILLGIEVDQWFSDLPLEQNNDFTELLQRRRARDALAKKIHEMEKRTNLQDCSADRPIRHEVSRFLERIPLKHGETLNINFMIDELINRTKNRPKVPGPESRRKSVAFHDTVDYDDFSKNMPCCSSFSEPPGQALEQSINASGMSQSAGSMSGQPASNWFASKEQYFPNVQDPTGYQSFDTYRPISSSRNEMIDDDQVWLTLQESGAGNQGNVRSSPPRPAGPGAASPARGSPPQGLGGSQPGTCQPNCSREGTSQISSQQDASQRSGVPQASVRESAEGARETDDAGKRGQDIEDMKCRCMERFWKCRRKRGKREDECDDFPHCFPMPFPYPYFF